MDKIPLYTKFLAVGFWTLNLFQLPPLSWRLLYHYGLCFSKFIFKIDDILNLVGITHKICLSFLKEPISTQKNVLIYFQLKHPKTNVYIYWRFYRLPDWLFCEYRVLEYFRLRAKIILDYFVFTQSLCIGNLFIWSNSKTL